MNWKKFGVLLLVLPLLLTGCVHIGWSESSSWGRSYGGRRIDGSGTRDSRTFEVTDFDAIDIGMLDTHLYLRQGDTYALRIDVDDNLFDYIHVKCRNNKLSIETDGFWLIPHLRADVYITAPAFNRIDLAGATEFISEMQLQGDTLKIDVAGACSGELDIAYDTFSIELAGAGDVLLRGSANTLKAEIAGAAEIDAQSLLTSKSDVSIAGAGSMKVHCTDKLDISIAGVGSLEYYGNPATINKSIAGLGSVRAGS